MIKHMKTVFLTIVILSLVLFIGCSKYEPDTTSGSITEISLDESLTLAKEAKETINLYTLSTCNDCIYLKEILVPYLENHSVEINEVVLDKEGTTDEEIQKNREKINKVFPEFNSVPSMYYLKKGKIIDSLFEIKDVNHLDEWVKSNKLDKK